MPFLPVPVRMKSATLPGGASRFRRGLLLPGALAVAVFAALQVATPHAVGVDGLFHAKAAEMIRRNLPRPWMPPFTWLDLTSLRQDRFADFHWGFHLLLVPFTFLGTETAAKVAPVVFASASFLALYFVLKKIGARYATAWMALALLASPIFLMRLSQNKAPSVMLGLLVLIAWTVLSRRDLASALLCLATGWIYPVVPIVAAVAGASLAGRALAEKRLPVRGAVAVAAGMALGLLVHPDFPRNLAFAWVNVTESVTIRAGEYAPLRPADAFENLALPGLVFLLAAGRALTGRAANRPAALAFGLQAATMAALTARYARGIDYLPPFVALFGAVALDEPLDRGLAALRRSGRARAAAGAAVIAAVAAGAAVWQVHRGRVIVQRNSAPVARRLEAAAHWLEEHTAPGERVLNLSSGDFEEMWLYDTKNTYFTGLNLNFLKAESPALYELYGEVYQRGDMAALTGLLERTESRYLLASDRLPPPLLKALASTPRFEVVYRDRSCFIARAATAGDTTP